MLGAIAGDIIGSRWEGTRVKRKDFELFAPGCRFTDDSVLTVAVADAILRGADYVDVFHEYFFAYPNAGYGGTFLRWALTRSRNAYQSWGNGSAMRVSPVAWAFQTEEEILGEARRSAEVTHDHPEGIRGAQATALAVFLARMNRPKNAIRSAIVEQFGYDLSGTIDDIRPAHPFDVSCQVTVPASIIAFLDSSDWIDAVRNAVSLGGDTDTMACIAGAIAEGFYGMPENVIEHTRTLLDPPLLRIVSLFDSRFGSPATDEEEV